MGGGRAGQGRRGLPLEVEAMRAQAPGPAAPPWAGRLACNLMPPLPFCSTADPLGALTAECVPGPAPCCVGCAHGGKGSIAASLPPPPPPHARPGGTGCKNEGNMDRCGVKNMFVRPAGYSTKEVAGMTVKQFCKDPTLNATRFNGGVIGSPVGQFGCVRGRVVGQGGGGGPGGWAGREAFGGPRRGSRSRPERQRGAGLAKSRHLRPFAVTPHALAHACCPPLSRLFPAATMPWPWCGSPPRAMPPRPRVTM